MRTGWKRYGKFGRVYIHAAYDYTRMVGIAIDESAWAGLQLLQSKEMLPFYNATHWLTSPSKNKDASLKQWKRAFRAIELHEEFNADTSQHCV